MKILKGKVISGIGDFSKKMKEIPGLLEAYKRKLGVELYPGTLNIQLDEEYSVPDNSMRLEKEDYGGTVSVYIVPAIIFGKKVFILRTEKYEIGEGTHAKTTLEIASNVRLRDEFNLCDGDEVEISLHY